MKRALSAVLAAALGLGAVPAEAQVALGRLSAPKASAAPTALPAGFVAPAASLAVPALAYSPAPAPYISLVPAPSVQPARRPVSVIPEAPRLAPARVESPLESLRVAAEPSRLAYSGAAFDGSVERSAAVEPAAAPAAPPRKGLLSRYRDHRNKPSTPFSTFGKTLMAGSLIGAAAPILWSAAPAFKFAYAALAADALVLLLLVPASLVVWAAGKLRKAPQTAAKPPPSRRRMAAAVALGLVLGAGLGLAPYQATGPFVERAAAYTDQSKPQAERAHARWISGGAIEAETVARLAENPVGRATLDALRDRGGVLRLPRFFVSRQDDSYAQHENLFDGVYLNESEITDHGWTVEQFLKDPALQRQLAREMSSTIVHELTHAVQGRRPPWTPGYFKNTIECEQEAFFQEMLFRLAALEADPAARNNGHDQWMVPDAADSLDGFLKSVAAMYEKNVVVGNDPYFNAYMAAQRARWPAFRVHIYEVLAARAPSPRMAKMYMDKAAAAAKEAGLPPPAPLAASR